MCEYEGKLPNTNLTNNTLSHICFLNNFLLAQLLVIFDFKHTLSVVSLCSSSSSTRWLLFNIAGCFLVNCEIHDQ